MKELQRVLLGIAVVAIALIVVAVLALRASDLDFWAEVAKALLTVAGTLITALLITGALTQYINRRQHERTVEETRREQERVNQEADRERERVKRDAKRHYWGEMLRDLVSINDTVQASRLLIETHRTVKTYGEEMRKLMICRGTLRTLEVDLEVTQGKEWLKADQESGKGLVKSLAEMRRHLERLGEVYRDWYLPASLRQRVDEAILERKIADSEFVNDDSLLDEPSQGWQYLASHFNHLWAEFLNSDAFESSVYRVEYRNALRRIREYLEQSNQIDGRGSTTRAQ